MCFIVHPDHWEEKTARKDIFCWKILIPYGEVRNKRYRSPYKNFPFAVNRVYHLGKPLKIEGISINEGFHSFSSIRRAKCSYHVIMPAIIPKGAHYYFSPEYHEYVSDAIKIIGE